jgi:thymidylate synthase ThyX
MKPAKGAAVDDMEQKIGERRSGPPTKPGPWWVPEDARQILPIGTTSEIVITANLREWRHIFRMRCDQYAHWEIRKVMCLLLLGLKDTLPAVFDDFIYMGKHKGEAYYVQRMSYNVLKRQLDVLAGCAPDELSRLVESTGATFR